jgi:hypothetical protein
MPNLTNSAPVPAMIEVSEVPEHLTDALAAVGD